MDPTSVYALQIVTGVDDYKHRGYVATGKLFLFTSREKCEEKLKEIIIESCLERLDDEDEAILPDFISERFFFNSIKDKWEWKRSDERFSVEITELMHEWCSEGEYIPHTWTYEIDEYLVE